MDTRGLTSLDVWQKARELAVDVIRNVLPRLPREERWAMGHQLRRSVLSIPSNTAEGFGRHYDRDGVRFCYIARGSIEETFSFLFLASDLGYLDPAEFARLKERLIEVRRMLNGTIAYLKRSKRGEDEPGADLFVREFLPSPYPLDEIQST